MDPQNFVKQYEDSSIDDYESNRFGQTVRVEKSDRLDSMVAQMNDQMNDMSLLSNQTTTTAGEFQKLGHHLSKKWESVTAVGPSRSQAPKKWKKQVSKYNP